MKAFHFLSLFLICSLGCEAIEIRGTLRDSVSNEGIPYGSVYSTDLTGGTLSDSIGNYILTFQNDLEPDSLVASCIGYYPVKVKYIEGVNRYDIPLTRKPDELTTVTVTPKGKLKTFVKGKKNGGGIANFYMAWNTLSQYKGESFGQVLTGNKKPTWLKSVGFHYVPSDKTLRKMRFRVTVYALDKKPDDLEIFVKEPCAVPEIFDYTIEEAADGKYHHDLATPVLLPENALVSIEFLENIKRGEELAYKGGLASFNWRKMSFSPTWVKMPMPSPFFFEFVQEK